MFSLPNLSNWGRGAPCSLGDRPPSPSGSASQSSELHWHEVAQIITSEGKSPCTLLETPVY